MKLSMDKDETGRDHWYAVSNDGRFVGDGTTPLNAVTTLAEFLEGAVG